MKSGSAKTHQAFFTETLSCLPASDRVDRHHFLHLSGTAKAEQENDPDHKYRADHVDKSHILITHDDRFRRNAHQQPAKRKAECKPDCRTCYGKRYIFDQVKSPDFHVPYADRFHDSYFTEFFGQGKGYHKTQHDKRHDDQDQAYHKQDACYDHIENI